MRGTKLSAILVATMLVATILAGCGAREREAANESTVPALSSLPATVEGVLEWDASVGMDEEDNESRGMGETSFGTLTVDGKEVYVEAETSLLQAASVPVEGAKVRAVLGSKSDDGEDPVYLITSVSRL